jgi:hypothetical protein
VSTDPSQNLRISDLDREAALQALGEHMSVGRIDLEEYGDRSAEVTTAKTRADLADVFEDLPEPHPKLDNAPAQPAAATAVEPVAKRDVITTWADRPLAQRLTSAAVPVAWAAGIVLFFAAGHIWLWFLLPVAVTAIGRGLWGQEWEHGGDGRGHDRHRDRDERRARRRGIAD